MVYAALEVWDEGMVLASLCYDITKEFPPKHSWVLKTKIRLAASRIAASVAEGYGQTGYGQTGAGQTGAGQSGYGFWHYIQQAQESLLELKTHLKFAERLSLLDPWISASLLAQCDVMAERLASLQVAA